MQAMGASGSALDRASAIPEHLDEATCRELLGKSFDPKEFKSLSNKETGLVPRETFILAVLKRTDCFLTHDWGSYDDGYRNHKLVSAVNRGLQDRGLTTWFDQEQMQGNIKKQMINGIDNTNCVVVFVTQRYIDKVGGDNAEDNCQLEFNYSCRKKTARKMVPVLMDKRAANPNDWDGEVGMVLGGSLYVDFTGDYEDDDWLNNQLDALTMSILGVIGTPVLPLQQLLRDVFNVSGTGVVGGTQSRSQQAAAPPLPAAGGASSPVKSATGPVVPLEELTVEQVGALLVNLGLGEFKNTLESAQINGSILEAVEGYEDLKDMGITMAVKAKMLMKKLPEFRSTGVPESLLKKSKSNGSDGAGATSIKADASASHSASVSAVSNIPSHEQLLQGVSACAAAKDIMGLLPYLSSTETAVQEAAATALNGVTDHRNRTRDSNERAAIAPLVHALKANESSPTTKEEVAITLRNITRDASVLTQVMDAGVAEPMIELLRSGSPKGKENAAAAIWNFARVDSVAIAFYNKGSIPLLIDLLRTGTMMGKEKSAGALANFACIDSLRSRLKADGVEAPLLDVAYEGTEGAKERALKTLELVQHDGISGVSNAKSAKNINALVGYLSPSYHPVVQEHAVVALNAVTDHRNSRDTSNERRAIEPLVLMMQRGSDLAKENAALTLRNITRNVDQVQHTLDAGAMPLMIQLLEHGKGKGKENAAAAVWNFVRGNYGPRVANSGVIPLLCTLLKTGNLAEKDKATGALINFCISTKDRIPAIRNSGVESALRGLKSDAPPDTKSRATDLLNYLNL